MTKTIYSKDFTDVGLPTKRYNSEGEVIGTIEGSWTFKFDYEGKQKSFKAPFKELTCNGVKLVEDEYEGTMYYTLYKRVFIEAIKEAEQAAFEKGLNL